MYDKIRYIRVTAGVCLGSLGGRYKGVEAPFIHAVLFIFISFILNFEVTNWSQTTRKVLPIIFFDKVQNCVI